MKLIKIGFSISITIQKIKYYYDEFTFFSSFSFSQPYLDYLAAISLETILWFN